MTPSEKINSYAKEVRANKERAQLVKDDLKAIYTRAKNDDVDVPALKEAIKKDSMDKAALEIFEHNVQQYSLWI